MNWVSDLDAMLADTGEDVTLRRYVGTTTRVSVDASCRASVRGYRPQELVGGVIQGDSLVILSVTDIEAAQWPGGQPESHPPSQLDRRIPRKDDKVVIAGRERNVQAAIPVYVGGELVRVELQVRG